MIRRILLGIAATLLILPTLTACSADEAPADYQRTIVLRSFDNWSDAKRLNPPLYVTMPHERIAITGLSFTGSLSEQDSKKLGTETELVAPDDSEFLHLRLAPQPPEYPEGGTPTVKLVIGEQAYDYTEILAKLDPSAPNPDSQLIVAVVPKDARVLLQLTDEGKTATFDLRDRAYADDEDSQLAAQYDAFGAQATLNGAVTSTGVIVKDDPTMTAILGGPWPFDISLEFDGANAVRKPFLQGAGWAAPGTTYVVLSPVRLSGSNSALATAYLDVASSVTLTPAGGTPVAPIASTMADSAGPTSIDIDGGALAFTIPTTAAKGTLTFAPNPSASGYIWQTLPAPATIELSLGG